MAMNSKRYEKDIKGKKFDFFEKYKPELIYSWESITEEKTDFDKNW